MVMIQNGNDLFELGFFDAVNGWGIGWWDGDVPDGGGQVCDD